MDLQNESLSRKRSIAICTPVIFFVLKNYLIHSLNEGNLLTNRENNNHYLVKI